MLYAIYDKDGRIIQFAHRKKFAEMQCRNGRRKVQCSEGASSETQYIDTSGTTPTPKPRPDTTCTTSGNTVAADGTSTIEFSGMDDGTVVKIKGPVTASFTADGDNASKSIAFTSPGKYRVIAQGIFPALPKEFVIDVTNE